MNLDVKDSADDLIQIEGALGTIAVRFYEGRRDDYTVMVFDDRKLLTKFIKALKQVRDVTFPKEDA